MLKFAGLIIAGALCISLMTGCEKVTQTTNETVPEPQSTSTSVEVDAGDDDTIVGIYTGQIDSNSIEIKISGSLKETSYRAFALSEELKDTFGKMELNPNEIVKIKFVEREEQQPLILKIERTAE